MSSRVVKSVLAGEHDQDISPVINSHGREKMFYTRPLQVPQIYALEGTKAEFIFHTPQDSHHRPTCYEEPPTVILEGYICQLPYRLLQADKQPYRWNRRPRRSAPACTQPSVGINLPIKSYWLGKASTQLARFLTTRPVNPLTRGWEASRIS
jgi:hypothetical protein